MSSKENSHTNRIDTSPNLQEYVTTLKSQFNDLDHEPCNVQCLRCDSVYILPTNEQDFLTHLFQEHKLVIADVEKIASLKSYIRYWRMKFEDQPLTTYCTTLTTKNNSEDNTAPDNFYFMLSDCLMEDKTLRDELRRAKLEWVLSQQVQERADTSFKRGCMFCRTEFTGSCIDYVNHLCEKHNILLGKPENLVFINEYLDKIQNNIESFICIYCEKNFKNRLVLKEHMRKKLHKQVNPNNKEYDKYYVTNYLPDQNYSSKKKCKPVLEAEDTDDPTGFSDNEDEDWSDWNNESINITCLFCPHSSPNFSEIMQHMKLEHEFDFEDITREFTFYQKVKAVNYIRKQIHTNRCVYCDVNTDEINSHMEKESHCKLPSKNMWDQPEFYFPMFESDSFLYSLDANSDNDEEVT